MGVRSGPRIYSESREEGGVLLIHSDTTDGSTSFVDSSPSRHTLAASGNPRHETDYSKFGATSIFIPNAYSDTVGIAAHSDFEFTGDFTIDMWVNVPSGGDRSFYVQSDGSTYLAFNYSKSATQFNLYINTGGPNQTPAYDLVGWNHVAWIRSGDQLVLYVNGTAINTVTTSATLGYAAGNQTLNRLGGGASTTPHYCDEVRISKGIARWTENFKPPHRRYATRDLVLCLDAMNAKSFAGEPTSNLCTSRISDGAISFATHGNNSPLGLTAASATTETPFGNTAYKLTFAAGGSYGTGYSNERAYTGNWTVDRAKTYSYGIWIAFNSDYAKLLFDVGNVYGYITGGNGMAVFSHGAGNGGLGETYIDAGGKRWHHYGRTAQTIGSSGTTTEFWVIFRNAATFTSEATLWVAGPQFEEGSSFTPFTSTSRAVANSWKDLSGNGNHGTHSAEDFGDAGDVSLYKKGQILLPTGTDNITSAPASINFDGGDDQVTVSHHSDFITAKTWMLWFKLDSIPGSSSMDSLFQHSDNWNNAGGISLQMIYGNFTWSWGKNWGGCCSVANSTLSTGVWYHFVGTSDGTTGTDKVKMYLNGELKDTGTASQIPDDTPGYLAIGYGNGGGTNGKIATFQVYTAELTHAQIKQIYNAQRSRFGK